MLLHSVEINVSYQLMLDCACKYKLGTCFFVGNLIVSMLFFSLEITVK